MGEDSEERLAFREKIANLSFEELAKLKEELGGQAINEVVFGVKKKEIVVQKRLNKNRPTEISSKINPNKLSQRIKVQPLSSARRDPRFDALCGDFNDGVFKKHYSFIGDIKKREKEELKKQLKVETNERTKEKLSFLVTRMENQEREEARLNAIKEKKRQEFETRIQMLREGKKPYYPKKSEKRLLDLAEKYEDLKKKGKVEKFIKKFRQKKKSQDSRKLDFNID